MEPRAPARPLGASAFHAAGLPALFALSGACNVACEVLWMRQLSVAYGSSTAASGAVLAAFLTGLGIGAAWGGRVSTWFRCALRGYGAVEMLAGCCALVVSTSVPTVAALMLRLPSGWPDAAVTLAQLVMGLVLLVPPAALMGAAYPAVLHAWCQAGLRRGRGVAVLYGCNTLGASAGALGAWFVLVPAVGVAHSLTLAALVNVAVGALAVLGAALRSRGQQAIALAGPAEVELEAHGHEPSPGRGPAEPRGRSSLLLLAAAALSGGAGLVCEMVWTRVLTLVIGASTASFTFMLAAYLLGTAGGATVGLVGARGTLSCARAATRAQWLLAAAAVACFGTLAVLPWMPLVYVWARGVFGGGDGQQMAQAAVCMAAMGVPAGLMGAAFTNLTLAYAGRGSHLAAAAGRLYGVNTAGAVAGAVGAVLVLLPTLGTDAAARWAAVTLALAAAMTTTPSTARRRVLLRLGAAAAVVAGCWAATPSLTYGVLSAAVYSRTFRTGVDVSEFDESALSASVEYVEEGRESLVTVRRQNGHRFLQIDGKTDASTLPNDMGTQTLLAALPALLHPHTPRNALLVGLGSGVSLGTLRAAGVPRVTVIEREPAVVRASRLFDTVSGGASAALASEDVRLVQQDALVAIAREPGRFDLICSEPSNVWITGVSELFTVEHMRNLRARLSPNGVLAQWIHGYGLSQESFAIVLRTMLRVFDDATLWSTDLAGSDFLLIGGLSPTTIDIPWLQSRLRDGGLAPLLRSVGVESVADLLTHFVADGTRLRQLVGHGPVHSHDYPVLAWLTPGTLLNEHRVGATLWQQPLGFLPTQVVWPPEPGTVRDLLLGVGSRHHARGASAAAVQVLAAATDAFPRHAAPASALARAMLTLGWSEAALTVVDDIYDGPADEPHVALQRGRALRRLGRDSEALTALRTALPLLCGDERGDALVASAVDAVRGEHPGANAALGELENLLAMHSGAITDTGFPCPDVRP